MRTTPNFSSCSQAVQNRFISKCVLYWFAIIFPPVSVEPKKLLHTRASLSTPIRAFVYCIRARPWQAPAPALFWFPKEGCMCAVQRAHSCLVRSLMMEQSGFPVVQKHVAHPQAVDRQCQVIKLTCPSSLQQSFWGWINRVLVSFFTFLHQLLPKLLFGKAVLSTFPSFFDCSPTCSGMLKATNGIFMQYCWHQSSK